MSGSNGIATVLTGLGDLLPGLESVYKDLHAHPELSIQETRTAGIAADRLRAATFEVTTGVGKTGVVGILRNGEGTVGRKLFRTGSRAAPRENQQAEGEQYPLEPVSIHEAATPRERAPVEAGRENR